MRMPGNHHPRTRIKQRRHIGNVMHQQDLPALDVESQVIGDVLRPRCRQVIVSTHDMQGCNRRQLLKNLRFADVTGVNDPLTALQRREGFGAE
ncbi:hypothetical protein D3C86_1871770 [compost metagenome]